MPLFQHNDFGLLPFDSQNMPKISQRLRDYLLEQGSARFQNCDSVLADKTGRGMTLYWFKRWLPNGQSVHRTWLVYAPSKKVAYCFCCLMFPHSSENHRSALAVGTGFSSWKKPEKLTVHESNPDHRNAFTTWKDAAERLRDGVTIDCELQNQIEEERQRWRSILKRVLDCIKYLASQNSALRGHLESISANPLDNPGKFLALLALLAKYDPIMYQHLEFAEQNPGKVTYLSPTIQNEFIGLLATTVREQLIDEIRESKYYGMMFDTTPDLGHREQMSQVMRYVEINYVAKTVTVKESFLGFMQIYDKSAKGIAASITKQLETDKIDLQDCRSQCYDNAAVMAGHLSGVQQRISAINPKAVFVNCDNHSLNLCGVHAASTEPVSVTFFGTIESVYLFFSRSTQRWDRLKSVLPVAVKRECATRWSSRNDAVRALHDGLDPLIDLLESLSTDTEATTETRGDAVQLQQSLLTFNFLSLLPFWFNILAKVDRVQKRLQDPTMNFRDAYEDIESLQKELNTARNNIVNSSLESGETRCSEWGIPVECRRRRKKRMPGELARDAGLSAKEELSRVMNAVLDRLNTELTNRFDRLKVLDQQFGFILNVGSLLSSNDTSLKHKCEALSNQYCNDINGDDLFYEIQDCRMLLRRRKGVKIETPQQLLIFIISYGDDVFPNLRVALQILLTIAVSIASCERSFSKLKLIMSYLRASMGQDRLSSLAQLSIEKPMVDKINFDDVIDRFAVSKCRKIHL